MTPRWDVLIVGARVAGVATALQLWRGGLSVLCLDRARRGSDTISTHALMRGGVLLLQRWGVLPALIAARTPAIRHTTFDYGEDRVDISIQPTPGVDALYAPRRTVLDDSLASSAENAGATLDFGLRVIGLSRSAAGRIDGVVVTRQGTSRRLSADFVIGADGRGSLVADHARAAPTAVGRNAGAYLYGYWSGMPAAGYEWFYRPGLSAGVIPTGDGLTCVFVGGRPADLARAVAARGGAPRAYRWLSARVGLAERLRDATPVESVRFVRALPSGFLRRAHGPGWALVGDA